MDEKVRLRKSVRVGIVRGKSQSHFQTSGTWDCLNGVVSGLSVADAGVF